MRENPGDKPNRTNFHTILNITFIKGFQLKILKTHLKKGNLPFEP